MDKRIWVSSEHKRALESVILPRCISLKREISSFTDEANNQQIVKRLSQDLAILAELVNSLKSDKYLTLKRRCQLLVETIVHAEWKKRIQAFSNHQKSILFWANLLPYQVDEIKGVETYRDILLLLNRSRWDALKTNKTNLDTITNLKACSEFILWEQKKGDPYKIYCINPLKKTMTSIELKAKYRIDGILFRAYKTSQKDEDVRRAGGILSKTGILDLLNTQVLRAQHPTIDFIVTIFEGK